MSKEQPVAVEEELVEAVAEFQLEVQERGGGREMRADEEVMDQPVKEVVRLGRRGAEVAAEHGLKQALI